MKRFITYLLLFLLSEILRIIFLIIGITYGLVTNFNKISDKLQELLMSNDRYIGGAACELLNKYLFKKETKHPLGDTRTTISSYIGKNKLDDTLTEEGIKWDSILNKIDNNHSIDAIGWKNNKINQK